MFKFRSIKQKVIFLVTSQLVLVLVTLLIVSLFLVNKQLGTQTERLFVSHASALNLSIEQRLSYLVENSELLATNELMVNALIDSEGREAYLAPLLSNFMKGKDVLYLNVVDFNGYPMFHSGDRVLQYNRSEHLRVALALNQTSVFIDDNQVLTVITPIEYYSTTQGALIIGFDLDAILSKNMISDTQNYIRLLKDNVVIFSDNYHEEIRYRSYLHEVGSELPYFSQLGIVLEVGLPEVIYNAPVREAMSVLLTVGVLLLFVSLLISRWTGIRITRPILELSSRVKQAHEGQDVRCSPLGSGDEVEGLAEAFDKRTLLLEHQAEHDSLTELPNRVLFIDRVQSAIKLCRRHEGMFAVLFIDLDRFKEVNDSYGHTVGDQLIQIVAEKIEGGIREGDSVARMGGDEFTVLVNDVAHETDVFRVTEKILALFESPISFDRYTFYLTCSIGVSVYPVDGDDVDTLLKNADAAMYKAKADGRNAYRLYKPELTDIIIERIKLEQQLRQAINGHQFVVYFQPQYQLATARMIGMEALIRWQHPDHGLLFPDSFIPLAEETGMIIDVDRLMMRLAMSEFRAWIVAGLAPGILSMNLSMIQLDQGDFIEFVKACLSEYELDAATVMFEVTETQAMLKPEQTVIALKQLSSLGVGLAIDDFGTGFSSLAYLKKFPVNKIKIDRSFVSDLPDDHDDVELTRAIISLSKSLKLDVIAEGVETEAHRQFLLSNDCHEGQGYLFSKPVAAAQVRLLLEGAMDTAVG
ncbi:EAL domain-containing protein [Amphritea sp. 1_MG-2023]|uniref:bifunctional diguanylate cyclase/phosphodiesterase n=1 Tax=Amphritea sp. 1_MG-2023 TaxID=3062670 RepID=UPI0026E189E5|nr:EAL domain-containing protein [Amphritea sp. 1_MG-2023]MDO6562009.1 EAL domain-containing protein [Amphritea sp. 1_MG-2023]